MINLLRYRKIELCCMFATIVWCRCQPLLRDYWYGDVSKDLQRIGFFFHSFDTKLTFPELSVHQYL